MTTPNQPEISAAEMVEHDYFWSADGQSSDGVVLNHPCGAQCVVAEHKHQAVLRHLNRDGLIERQRKAIARLTAELDAARKRAVHPMSERPSYWPAIVACTTEGGNTETIECYGFDEFDHAAERPLWWVYADAITAPSEGKVDAKCTDCHGTGTIIMYGGPNQPCKCRQPSQPINHQPKQCRTCGKWGANSRRVTGSQPHISWCSAGKGAMRRDDSCDKHEPVEGGK
jgi:hypothetical protein